MLCGSRSGQQCCLPAGTFVITEKGIDGGERGATDEFRAKMRNCFKTDFTTEQGETFTETIWLAPGAYLQASPQKFRLHRLLPWDVAPCIETLQETRDTNVTRQMMAGAFYAGFPQRSSDNERTAHTTPPSLLRHIFSLAASYQTTHATPPTMRAWQNA
jgi:hypothetical protein